MVAAAPARACAIVVTNQKMSEIILRDEFHGEWNYTLQPLAFLHRKVLQTVSIRQDKTFFLEKLK